MSYQLPQGSVQGGSAIPAGLQAPWIVELDARPRPRPDDHRRRQAGLDRPDTDTELVPDPVRGGDQQARREADFERSSDSPLATLEQALEDVSADSTSAEWVDSPTAEWSGAPASIGSLHPTRRKSHPTSEPRPHSLIGKRPQARPVSARRQGTGGSSVGTAALPFAFTRAGHRVRGNTVIAATRFCLTIVKDSKAGCALMIWTGFSISPTSFLNDPTLLGALNRPGF